MTNIIFYVLGSNTSEQKHAFLSKLLGQLYDTQKQVCILVEPPMTIAALDSALWRHPEANFIPHATAEDNLPDAPIFICDNLTQSHHADVLVNLTGTPPNQFSRFKRVVEIVSQAEPFLSQSRQSYKFYKSRGYPIEQHTLKNY